MKYNRILPSLLTILLISCSNAKTATSKIFCFDTYIDIKLINGNKDNVIDIEDIFYRYDKLSDNYQNRSINNIYTINQTNDPVVVDEDLYKLLQTSFSVDTKYFNPLCGSLAKKWKDALDKKEVLSDAIIEEELDKIVNTHLSFLDGNKIQKEGPAEIDLGGIAKGYALDVVKSYLDAKEMTQYLINAGSSSIILGEKNTKDGLFNVGLKDINNGYLKLKNCFVSTSSISEQNAVINDVTYSHIINPLTGSALSVNDVVIVVSNNGYQGDALSTSMMMNTVEEIKELETKFDVKTIVVKDGNIIYQNNNIEVYYH